MRDSEHLLLLCQSPPVRKCVCVCVLGMIPYINTLYCSNSLFLRFVLKGFSKDGRDLTEAETKAFLKAGDKDGDGKIGIDGESNICNIVSAHIDLEI